jgi:hypothetical protein
MALGGCGSALRAIAACPYALGSRGGQQSRHPDQIVGCHREGELEAHVRQPSHFHLGEAGDRLAPAERLLDELAFALAHLVALVACRPAVDRGAFDLRRDVRRHALLPEIGDEVGRVVALVGSQRQAERGSCRSIIASAACRSALPVAAVASACTTRPCRFSISACPMK